MHYKKGRPYFTWELAKAHKRNEALDCRNYASAAIEITGLPLKKQDEQPQQKKTAKRRRRRTGGIGINGRNHVRNSTEALRCMARSRNAGNKCTIIYDRQQDIDKSKSDRDQKRDRILAAESHNIRELKEKQWKKQSKKICTARLIKVCPIFPVFLGKITYRKYK